MAEILIDALSLNGSASTGGRIIAMKRPSIAMTGQAGISGKLVLIVKSKTSASASASTTSAGRRLPTIKGALIGRATASSSGRKYKTIKASIIAESTVEAFTFDRDLKTEIGDYLPAFYRDISDVMKMADVDATEVIRLRAYLDNLLDNLYVNSSDNLLDRWERELGIETIPQRSVDSRRHYINAKLRGKGVATVDLLKSIVDAFYYAEITDKPRESSVKVKLLGKRGIPKNLEDIDVAVTDVIPAHLGTEYEFTYATWGEMNDGLLTWQEAEDKTMKELEETFYVEPDFPYND